jgi:HEAT repeat protein
MSAPLETLLRDARTDLVLSRIENDPSIINEVVGHLDSDIRSIKFNSIFVLGELGQKGEVGINKLTKCLSDNDWSIRRECARSLGKIGNSAHSAVSTLSQLLEDQEVSIRKEVAIALGKIGVASDEAINALINGLKDQDEEVRTEVAKALGEIGPEAYIAIPNLMQSLKDVSWSVRTESTQAISLIGKESKKAIPTLIKALEDDDWRVRYRVIDTLAKIGQDVIPNLREILHDKNPVVRKGAIEVLGELKISDLVILKEMASLLFDHIERVRGYTADALRSVGKDAVPILIESIEKANKEMKILLISAIGGIGINAKEAIPTIHEILKFEEKNKEERIKKLYSGSFFDKISIAGSNLFHDPFSSKAMVRAEAARALGKIGANSEEALEALKEALIDPKSAVRREAALALGKLGSFASSAILPLIKALNDREPDVRWRASEALGLIGVKEPEVIAGLEGLVHDECDYVCESAIVALDNLTEK